MSTPTPADLPKATEHLWRTYSTINEWIRYADVKAGALLAANGVLATAVIGSLKDVRPQLAANPMAVLLAIVGVLALVVSAWKCLDCIRPRLGSGTKSRLFFGDIADAPDAESYRKSAEVLGLEAEAFRELSQQVWVNARVARDKHGLIAQAVWALGACLLCALGAGVLIAL